MERSKSSLSDWSNDPQYVGIVSRLVIWIVRLLPLWTFQILGRSLVFVTNAFAKKEFQLIYRNVELIYGLAPHSSFAKQFARQVLRHTVYCQVETLKLIVSPELGHFKGLSELKRTLDQHSDQGFVVAAAHLGSWELVGHALSSAQGKPIVALAKPPKKKFLQNSLQNFRTAMRTHILWTNRASLLRDMLSAIKNKFALVFVMDQKPNSGKGHLVDFMGKPTMFVQGPAAVAKKTKAKVLAVYCLREEPWMYRIEHEIIDADRFNTELDLTARLAECTERMIRMYPEQWTWNYRRWPQENVDPAEEALPVITIQ